MQFISDKSLFAVISGLGFSQDCAWEKRFSFGEQPKTAWSC